MKLYFLMLPILIWGFIFADCAVSADPSAGKSNKRWGITTKQAVEDEEDDKDEIEEDEIDLKKNPKDNLPGKEMSDGEEDPDAGAPKKKDVAGAKDQNAEKKSVEKKSVRESQPDAKIPGKTEEIDKKEAGGKPKNQKEKVELIKWESEAQQAKCEEYLVSLKEAFLKARYYSIQGVACGTAENARSFMTLINHCKQDCPDKFLKKNGYTTRIIRNLSWLEKLGSERCSDDNISLPQTYTDERRQ